MGLLSTATSTNRVVSQGNTYRYTTEPAQQFSTVSATAEGSTYTVGERVLVTQWHVAAMFSKRYSYVGLDEDSAKTIAESVSSAYVKSMPRYALGIYVDSTRGISVYKYLPVEGGGIPTCCAAATPVHVEGTMWSVEVDVDVTIDAYYDTAPSLSTIKSLFSDIANFPGGY